MDTPQELLVPDAAQDEARAAPVVRCLAGTIGALAAAGGLASPKRLETALAVAASIGETLGEPSLTRVLTLRALSAPPAPREALGLLETGRDHTFRRRPRVDHARPDAPAGG
ncbi:MAG: hypothetical protein WDN25_02735 [Acetobacteraceae bacterium]